MNILHSIGNLLVALILFCAAFVECLVEFVMNKVIWMIDTLFCSNPEEVFHKQRFSVEPIYKKQSESGVAICELDDKAMMRASQFPILPEQLITKARVVIASEFGTAKGCNVDELLAEDFEFVAPIVHLPRARFVEAFGQFDLYKAFPNFKTNNTFWVDPMEPNRVWFISRANGKHTGPLNFGKIQYAPTNKTVLSPPQASSMLFNEDGKCYMLTVGYCMDRTVGNTNGLGAMFGILKGIDKPLPFKEANALQTPSLAFAAAQRFGKVFGM
jgi:hypothetical protein